MRTRYLAVLIAACLSINGCETDKAIKQEDTYQVITPQVRDVTYLTDYVADIHAVKFVEIRSKVKSYMEQIHVDEGQEVKKGQLLFTLNFVEFKKELQEAEALYHSALADLKAAKVELRNVRLLVSKDILSDSEQAVAEAKLEAEEAHVHEAQANKERAELNIAFSKIKAPFDGQINRIPKKVGSLINEGEMLTSISDDSEIFAYFNFSEVDYLNRLKAGSPKIETVKLELANGSLYGYSGKIEMIGSLFDRSTGTISLRARFPNPDGILKHGSSAQVVIANELDDALVIPQKSTFEIQDQLYAYTVDKEGMLHQRGIKSKMRLPHYYVIAGGLSRNDKIVYEGVENLRDGEKIQFILADAAELMLDSAQPGQ